MIFYLTFQIRANFIFGMHLIFFKSYKVDGMVIEMCITTNNHIPDCSIVAIDKASGQLLKSHWHQSICRELIKSNSMDAAALGPSVKALGTIIN